MSERTRKPMARAFRDAEAVRDELAASLLPSINESGRKLKPYVRGCYQQNLTERAVQALDYLLRITTEPR